MCGHIVQMNFTLEINSLVTLVADKKKQTNPWQQIGVAEMRG